MHTERHRNGFPRLPTVSTEQHHLLTQGRTGELIEKRSLEVFAAPHPPTGAMLLIEAMHALQQRGIQRLSR